VLSALPWVGQELYQKKEKDLEALLSQIAAYIQSVYVFNVLNYVELLISKNFTLCIASYAHSIVSDFSLS